MDAGSSQTTTMTSCAALVTAMTLTGRGRTLCRRPSAWSGLNLVSIAWRPPVRRQDHLVFVHRTSLPHERESLADQFVGAGKMQLLRHALSVAHVHERQAGLDHGAQPTAQPAGLVHFGEDAAVARDTLEGIDGLIDAAGLRIGSQNQMDHELELRFEQ